MMGAVVYGDVCMVGWYLVRQWADEGQLVVGWYSIGFLVVVVAVQGCNGIRFSTFVLSAFPSDLSATSL